MKVSPRTLALGAVGLFVLIQAYRPSRTNPPMNVQQDISAVMRVDPDVLSVLDRSCNDCHSNRTVWPWYSEVAPLSWAVASDVDNARRHMNFSEWGSYTDYQRQSHLDEICKIVTQRDMPPFTYALAHRNAALSDPERQMICQWTKESAGNAAQALQGE
jgi:hypothetical protein